METTKLTSAQSKSRSLRATVPASIIRHFGLIDGDELSWDLEARDGTIIIVVRPIKADRSLHSTPRKTQKGDGSVLSRARVVRGDFQREQGRDRK